MQTHNFDKWGQVKACPFPNRKLPRTAKAEETKEKKNYLRERERESLKIRESVEVVAFLTFTIENADDN